MGGFCYQGPVALTYTVAGLQTELDAVQAATDGSDWDTARKKLIRARLVLAGLPEEAGASGTTLRMRQTLDDLSKLIDEAKGEASSATDNQRRILTLRMAHRV